MENENNYQTVLLVFFELSKSIEYPSTTVDLIKHTSFHIVNSINTWFRDSMQLNVDVSSGVQFITSDYSQPVPI
jgi:hypothetical protein